MPVRRAITHSARSMVDAWCFTDHYGPDDVTIGIGMQVAHHPYTAHQTVTWLFAGEMEHRDSLGTVQRVRPSELNLMTAGNGISHSEGSPADRPSTLHGVQLWTALPASAAGVAPHFEHLGQSALTRYALPRASVNLLAGDLVCPTPTSQQTSTAVGAE